MEIVNQDLETRVSALEEEMIRIKQKECDRLSAKLEEEQFRLWQANMQMFTKCYHPIQR